MKITRKRGSRFGLALCSGGARGFANIGVLKELDKHNIIPDYIAGASMGAIIGAMYANGNTIHEIERMAIEGRWKEFLRFTVPKTGLIEGKYMRDYFRKELKLNNFKRFKILFSAVSTNVDTGKTVVLDKGDSTKAVYASLAIPGIFTPLNYKRMTLVDGGLTSPLPTKEVREMGADFVLGVDLSMSVEEMTERKGKIIGFDKNSEFVKYMKEKFKQSQKEILKDHIINTRKRIPEFAKGTIEKFIDRFYDPDKIIQKINISDQFGMFDILSKTMFIMTNQLIIEKVNNDYHDIIIKPKLEGTGVINADHIEKIIEEGRLATKKQIPKIKKRIQTA